MKSFVRISALLWADIFVEFALFVLQNYFTDVWNLSFTNAAAIINFWGGLSNILPVFFLFFIHVVLGNFGGLVISSVAYSAGIGLIALSTPPILARTTKTCRRFEPECIGHTQKSLLYSGLVFVAIGKAGNEVAVKPFLEEQQAQNEEDKDGLILLKLCAFVLVVIVALAGAIGIPYIKPWSLRFGIPAIVTLFATILFLTGWFTYFRARLKGSPITSIVKVFIASACNIHKPFPLDPNLYRVDEDDIYSYDTEPRNHQTFTRTRALRCLEKAAIKSTENEESKKWKQCTIREVEEAKIAVRMIPIWLTFIVCGIVSSTGNTYFVAQAENMNPNVGRLRVTQQVFLLIYRFAKYLFGIIAGIYLGESTRTNGSSSSYSSKKRYASAIGVAVAMIFSILCCVTAAGVEKMRLNVITRHDLLDKPKANIPMSIFWLSFQFILLAGLDSFLEKSISAFYRDQAPDSMKNYLEYFAKFVSGLGFMCNVVTVVVVGKVSEKVGSKKNWFQYTLNRSRLDNYYLVLAALSAVNLIVFVLVACNYTYKNRAVQEAGEEAAAGGQPSTAPDDGDNDNDGNSSYCCCC